MRAKDSIDSLQRNNKKLEQENKNLRKRLADCVKAEQDRIAQENHQKDHGRDNQQVQILRMLGTQKGKSVKQIAEILGIGEELVLTHLASLSHENFVHSSDYTEDPDWEDPCPPYHSVWYIQQPGREYLAKNQLLT